MLCNILNTTVLLAELKGTASRPEGHELKRTLIKKNLLKCYKCLNSCATLVHDIVKYYVFGYKKLQLFTKKLALHDC